jgi:hypothetical protein
MFDLLNEDLLVEMFRRPRQIYGKSSLILLQLIRMPDNPERNMKNENCSSQLRANFKRHVTFRKTDESLVCSDET